MSSAAHQKHISRELFGDEIMANIKLAKLCVSTEGGRRKAAAERRPRKRPRGGQQITDYLSIAAIDMNLRRGPVGES